MAHRVNSIRGAVLIAMVATAVPTPATAAPPRDPCALLTQAQVSAALGGAVGPGKALAGSVCQWQQQGKPGAELLKLDVNVVTTDRYNRAKSVTLGTVTPVGGLGEDAYFATIKAGQTSIATLNVKKGASAVIIRVCGKRPVEDYEAKEKVVAQALVPKL